MTEYNTLLAPLLDFPPSEECPEASQGGTCQFRHPKHSGAALAPASCHQHNASISTIWQISYPFTLFPALLMGCAL